MDHQPAAFGRRLAARVLDLAFALGLTFVLVIPVTLLLIPVILSGADQNTWSVIGAATCYFIAYVALEFFLLIRRGGQTLGKGLMGLRVVSTTGSGITPSAPSALLRLTILFLPFVLGSLAGGNPDSSILQTLGSIAFLALLVSLVLAAVPRWQRRALHDHAAGTRVVRAPKRGLKFRDDLRMMVPGKIDMTKRL